MWIENGFWDSSLWITIHWFQNSKSVLFFVLEKNWFFSIKNFFKNYFLKNKIEIFEKNKRGKILQNQRILCSNKHFCISFLSISVVILIDSNQKKLFEIFEKFLKKVFGKLDKKCFLFPYFFVEILPFFLLLSFFLRIFVLFFCFFLFFWSVSFFHFPFGLFFGFLIISSSYLSLFLILFIIAQCSF